MIILFRMTVPGRTHDKVYMCHKAQVIAKTSGRMLWQIEFGDRIHKIFIDDLVGVFDDIESLCKFRETHKIRMHRFFETTDKDAEKERYLEGIGIPISLHERLLEKYAAMNVIRRFEEDYFSHTRHVPTPREVMHYEEPPYVRLAEYVAAKDVVGEIDDELGTARAR